MRDATYATTTSYPADSRDVTAARISSAGISIATTTYDKVETYLIVCTIQCQLPWGTMPQLRK